MIVNQKFNLQAFTEHIAYCSQKYVAKIIKCSYFYQILKLYM